MCRFGGWNFAGGALGGAVGGKGRYFVCIHVGSFLKLGTVRGFCSKFLSLLPIREALIA